MKIKDFSITNFRSITKAHKISLSSYNVLVGKNNEGKSNILKAINIAMNILSEVREDRMQLGRSYSNASYYTNSRNSDDRFIWQRDFPRSIGKNARKTTEFRINFKLDSNEIKEFSQEVKLQNNGDLQALITINEKERPKIEYPKKGKNTKESYKKASKRISAFLSKRINFNYIPAIRTTEEAMGVVERMLSIKMRVLDKNEGYLDLIRQIKDYQKPIQDEIAQEVKEVLSVFIPNIRDVRIESEDRRVRAALRNDFDIIIDDGNETPIAYKGDGIKSLAALGLLKYKGETEKDSIIAIEEPESHLHPLAIHQLNEVIKSLANDNQVIISTHSPVLVSRDKVEANIIIDGGEARVTENIAEIRDLLGVRASDNLTNANFVLLVEGKNDIKILNALLPLLSDGLKEALESKSLVIDQMGGGDNLGYKISLIEAALCKYHCFLDGDSKGKSAFRKASEKGLINNKNITFTYIDGLDESELEDYLSLDLYKNEILNSDGVNLTDFNLNRRDKWSDRLKYCFESQGKDFSESIKNRIKSKIADMASSKPRDCAVGEKFSSLVHSLEELIYKKP